ncbi:MAG: hypothetical protein ACXWM6_09335, partial [Thermodesulfobacteriota bacterium]
MKRLLEDRKEFSGSRMALISSVILTALSMVSISSSGPIFSQNSSIPFTNTVASSGMGGYVVIGWNDLGMHCINSSYAELAVLPPFNNLRAQVIQRG